MSRLYLALACLLLLTVVATSAPAQMPVPKPAPELSQLDYLAGDWILDGEMKPGAMGPGGKVTSTAHVYWMEGKFFLISDSKMTGALGDGAYLAVMGYDPDKKVYTYNDFSMGQVGHSEGTVSSDTWTWTSDENMGGQTIKGRYTMKILSPTSYTYKYEMSKDGTNWTTVMEGKAAKK